MRDKTHTNDVHRLRLSREIILIKAAHALPMQTIEHRFLEHVGLVCAHKLVSRMSEVEPIARGLL